MSTKLTNPKPILKAGVIYSADNGQLICSKCAGQSALYTGRDISGQRVTALTQDDADEWMRSFGRALTCEGKCTKHEPTEGVEEDVACDCTRSYGPRAICTCTK